MLGDTTIDNGAPRVAQVTRNPSTLLSVDLHIEGGSGLRLKETYSCNQTCVPHLCYQQMFDSAVCYECSALLYSSSRLSCTVLRSYFTASPSGNGRQESGTTALCFVLRYAHSMRSCEHSTAAEKIISCSLVTLKRIRYNPCCLFAFQRQASSNANMLTLAAKIIDTQLY